MSYVLRITGPVETAGLYLLVTNDPHNPYRATEREFATRFRTRTAVYSARAQHEVRKSWYPADAPERRVLLRVEPVNGAS